MLAIITSWDSLLAWVSYKIFVGEGEGVEEGGGRESLSSQ